MPNDDGYDYWRGDDLSYPRPVKWDLPGYIHTIPVKKTVISHR